MYYLFDLFYNSYFEFISMQNVDKESQIQNMGVDCVYMNYTFDCFMDLLYVVGCVVEYFYRIKITNKSFNVTRLRSP
jgi:hypothetical protein